MYLIMIAWDLIYTVTEESTMNLIKRIKALFSKQNSQTHKALIALEVRLDRLERGYIVLLKRVLEIDSVQFPPSSRTMDFTTKILQTPNDELNKGLNEPEPTLH